jgi:hypothetical protein
LYFKIGGDPSKVVNTKLAPNNLFYLMELFYIFRRRLTISFDLILFLCKGKTIKSKFYFYFYSYRARTVNPISDPQPTHSPTRYRAREKIPHPLLRSSPAVGADSGPAPRQGPPNELLRAAPYHSLAAGFRPRAEPSPRAAAPARDAEEKALHVNASCSPPC